MGFNVRSSSSSCPPNAGVRRRRTPLSLAAGVGLAAGVVALSTGGTLGAGAAARPAVPKAYLSALTPAQIQGLAANASQRSIVLLANQHTETPKAGGARAGRLSADQAPILNELRQLHAANLHAYSFVNAVSATLSAAEVARLQADPAVSAVVPDSSVTIDDAQQPAVSTQDSGAAGPGTVATGNQVCPADPDRPLLEPEALQTMNVDLGPGGAPAAHSLANGAGVKVAVFPDGLDPNIPDFIRPDGSHAIFDYQDFSGDGTGARTSGVEAFGDASSIIAQGTEVADLSGEVNPAHPLPPGCTIRVEGVAPGAELAVLKVFSTESALNSEILQGVEYAIDVDHVDVLSQSFGGNPVPNPGTDPIAVADQDAVNAGITVVVSSGDAGGTDTIGTPAVDPGVISAGASTTYRLYGQTTSYGFQFGSGGWESNQVSGLSSSGVTEANRTVDVLAPGEAGWAACSTDTSVFTGCGDSYHGSNPQPIVAFGGTSESAPLTAGAAALVIEAYRNTHGGSTPSPALVKQILMSTAQDLDSRASDQGAGLIDAYRAVQAAMSLGSADPSGDALLYSPNAINVIGQPHASTTTTVSVSNDGAAPQTVTPAVRALGAPSTIAQGTLALDQASDPTFIWQTGASVGDEHQVPFSVPAGTDRLHAAIAWHQPDSALFQTIRFDLFDPQGRLALQSRPQGPAGYQSGGFSEGEIHDAAAGPWTLLVFDTAFAGPDKYTGPLAYTITGQSFHTVAGAVTPASATVAPGASASFQVTTTNPASPGDTSESLVFGAPESGVARGTVPITLRSLASVGRSFTGTLTGGNARMPFYGQEVPYQFTVTGHHSSIDATVHVANPGYKVFAFLVDPGGTPVDVQSSALWDGSGTNTQDITLFRQDPAPGRWSLLVVQVFNVDSILTSTPFTATLSYDLVAAAASGLPTNVHRSIPHTSTTQAVITVRNTGTTPEAYMVDARRSQQTTLPLTSLVKPVDVPLPISDFSTVPQFVVPPYSTGAQIAAQSTVPISLDTSPNFGTPDVEGVSSANAAVATLSAAELPASLYSCAPAEIGPFGGGSATSTTFSCGGLAMTDAFAPDVATSAGNLWSDLEVGTTSYNPLVLGPGQTGSILVAIDPSDPVGTRVSGFLTLETFNFNTISSDELATFPYAYTVG